jgi:tetratricopeptide (TPR) repeat protein
MKTFKPDLLQTAIAGTFNALLLTVPLFFTFTTEELFEFNKMVLTYLYGLVIVTLWAVRMILYRQYIFKQTKLDIPILLFVLSQLLSTLFSIHPYTSLLGYYTRFHGGLLSTLTYVALYYAFVSNIDNKQLKSFFTTSFVAAGLVAIYAIFEHFGHSFSCYMVSGGTSFGVDCWVQDVKSRVFATFGQPNWLAAYMITLLPLALYSTQQANKWWQKYLWILLTTLLFITVLYTRSRSGILGMGVGLGIYGLLCLYIWKKQQILQPRLILNKNWAVVSCVVICGLLFVFIDHPFSRNLHSYFSTPASPATVVTPDEVAPANRLEIGGSDSGEIRKIVWQGALEVWKRYPLLGSGVETFAYSYYQDRPVAHNGVTEWDFLYNKAHNEFLNFLATTGLFGLISYCVLLGSFCILTLQRFYAAVQLEKYERAVLYSSLLAGVAALSVSNFFGFSTVMVTVLLFLFFAISEIFAVSIQKPLPDKVILTNWQYTLLILVGISSLIGLYKLYSYHSADVAYTRAKAFFAQGDVAAGLNEISAAIGKTPQEALFYDTLADQYSTYALYFANAGLATQAAELTERANITSQATLDLNDRQINYYKTRARILINLSQLKPQLITQAEETLLHAQKLAPTDPKLVYNLGLVMLWQDKADAGVAYLEKATALKPDYELPRVQLAKTYETLGEREKALEQWQYISTKLNPNSVEAREKIASLSAQKRE